MPVQQPRDRATQMAADSACTDERPDSDERLVLRNYDDSSHIVHVTCTERDGTRAFTQTVSIAARATISVRPTRNRAVYHVEARLDSGAVAHADCLLGGGIDECAKIETGNGVISVVDGYYGSANHV